MGKAIMFMVFVWIGVSILGGIFQGSTMAMATTELTKAIDDDDTTINVTSTDGFPDTGFITILDERIGYADTTDTTFEGSFAQPLLRGAQDTTATAHAVGELVRTRESSMLNDSLNYKIAVLTDASGMVAFIAIPFAFLSLLATFFTLPLGFMGTDLAILTYIWATIALGLLVVIALSIVGGRRV